MKKILPWLVVGGILAVIFRKELKAYIEKAVALIKKSEGLRLEAYKDVGGLLTIGYGHLLLKHETFRKITQTEAEALLAKDFEKADAVIERYVKAHLTDNQRAALLSLIFNIGGGNFVNSTLLKKLNAGDYAGAAQQFDRWVYVNKTVVPGLVKRRKEEQKIFLA